MIDTKLLREARIQARLSQKEMADRLGISREAYNSIETGKSQPGRKIKVEDLEELLGKRVEQSKVEPANITIICNELSELKKYLAKLGYEVKIEKVV